MPARDGVARVSSEHAHQLADHLALGELHYRRARGRSRRVLDDREVALRERCDLRQMRDAQELALPRQLAQLGPDGTRGLSADTRIELVEGERRPVAGLRP